MRSVFPARFSRSWFRAATAAFAPGAAAAHAIVTSKTQTWSVTGCTAVMSGRRWLRSSLSTASQRLSS